MLLVSYIVRALRHRPDIDTVGHIDLVRPALHNQGVFLVVYGIGGDGIAGLIDCRHMLSVREDNQILGVIPADREGELFGQKTCLGIYLIHADGILPGGGTEKMGTIRRQRKA